MSDLLENFASREECSSLMNHLDVLIAKKYEKELKNYYYYSDFDTLFKYRNKNIQQPYFNMELSECESSFKTKIKTMIKN